MLSFYVPPNSPCNLICISFCSFGLNCFSPAITQHPLAPLFAFSSIFFLRPRYSGDKLDKQDTENVLSKTDQPHNCRVKQRQQQHLTLSRENGIEEVQQVLRIQTEKGDRCSHMFALVQKFRRSKHKPSIFELKCPDHLK